MQMFDQSVDVVSGVGGCVLSVIGLQADGIFATVAAIASAANAIFLLITLCIRLFVAVKHRVTNKTDDAEFFGELEKISGAAQSASEILNRKENRDHEYNQ
jgi:hypothetical protein